MPTEPGNRRAVVSLGTARGNYGRGLRRLSASLRRVGFGGEQLLWPPGRFPAGCPDQLEVPFAFKPFCLAEATARGIDSLLWLDASCLAIKSLDPLFAAIEANGHLLFRNGARVVGEWASDAALEALSLSRDEAMALPELNAAAIGLSVRHPVGAAFLDQWLGLARAGVVFRGTREPLTSWEDYRDVKWNRADRVSTDP